MAQPSTHQEEDNMLRNIYTIVISDLIFSTSFILLLQENVGFVLAVNLTLRPILIFLISFSSFWLCGKLKITNLNIEILLAFIFSYAFANFLIFALKSNNKGLTETLTDIHTNLTLFSFLILPIVISYFLLIITKAIWK